MPCRLPSAAHIGWAWGRSQAWAQVRLTAVGGDERFEGPLWDAP